MQAYVFMQCMQWLCPVQRFWASLWRGIINCIDICRPWRNIIELNVTCIYSYVLHYLQ